MRRFLLAAVLLAAASVPSPGHEMKIGNIRISHPWCKLAASEPGTLSAYIKIANVGEADDRLIGAELATARGVRIRLAGLEAKSIRVPAGASLAVRPNSVSLTFTGLTSMPVDGETIGGTLIFEKAGAIAVDFEIEG